MNEYSAVYLLTALAVGLPAYILLRRGRLKASPAKGSRLGEFGEFIHLRDVFRVAVMLEEEGLAFYSKLAARSRDGRVQELCARLAGEEAAHRQLFLDLLGHWNPLEVNPLTWPAFLERVKKEGFFADPPAENASEDEMAAYAIRQELKSVEFYQLFEAGFPLAWKRQRLHRLVQEERGHEAKLRAAYPRLK